MTDVKQYSLVLSVDPPLTLRGVWPVTEQEWSQMMVVLGAMKPGLVIERKP